MDVENIRISKYAKDLFVWLYLDITIILCMKVVWRRHAHGLGCKLLHETILNDWFIDIELSRNCKWAKIWRKRMLSRQEVEWSTRSLSVRPKLPAKKVIKIRKEFSQQSPTVWWDRREHYCKSTQGCWRTWDWNRFSCQCWEWIRQGMRSVACGIECEYWCMSCEARKSNIFSIPQMW